MFEAHARDGRRVQYDGAAGPDEEQIQLTVKVGSLEVHRAETGLVIQLDEAEEGIFMPDETLPLLADVITRMKTWL